MTNSASRPTWWIVELTWVLGSLLIGLIVLPGMVYAVGMRLFGAYKALAGPATLSGFYADFAASLAHAELPAWTLAAGPLVTIYLIRLLLGGIGSPAHGEPGN